MVLASRRRHRRELLDTVVRLTLRSLTCRISLRLGDGSMRVAGSGRLRPATAEPHPVEEHPGEPALRIDDLVVEFATPAGTVRAVDHVTYQVARGETLAVVGETGSGKSVTVLAALGLLSAGNVHRVSGRAEVGGQDLLALPARERRTRLGADVAMIFQDPMSALDPVQRVGDQIAEALRAHDRALTARTARARVLELLTQVGVPQPEIRYDQYPHQFSGGMCQRVVIAMAIANRPTVLIADEPTTALDVSVQAQILELLRLAARETGAATVLITHDLGVVAEMADRAAVMYAGRIVETAPVARIFGRPQHPYTASLLASLPRLDQPRGRLRAIPGQPPDLRERSAGCAFAPRCPIGGDLPECRTERPLLVPRDDGAVACHHAGQAVTLLPQPGARPSAARPDDAPAVVEVAGLAKVFPIRRGLLARTVATARAVDGVDLRIGQGSTLGLVGESGCGKSTLARSLIRLLEPTAGSIRIDGADLLRANGRQLRRLRQRVQMVYQDPYSSLNPRLSVGDNAAEPLRLAGVPRTERRRTVLELFEKVGLRPEHADRLPAEFSGGQRQRVAIARALAPGPALVIFDEPVSALDVSVQAQVLNLLRDLQDETGVAYLFVSHDLSVVRQMADTVAVMYLGAIVETGAAGQLYRRPRHPYTRALLDSIPVPDPSVRRSRVPLTGDPPDPTAATTGCRFRSRCPLGRDRAACADRTPELRQVDGRWTACHFAEEVA
ncbi:dipeptide ABC transporter ATP-binding protein [Actinocatenispora comari]|nr:ABC transporter ATP-binding protein [Actinocatenispora comari]